ncbi:MAG: DUF3662 domain-containing protein [Peptococcaceae bacterium]|jgi:hypothetical protein|nr:DUF3662 domain-containing protein [Peptococcaceae bacterium]
MSIVNRFEEIAEALFTGVFKKDQTKMQPVVIARELVKVMHQHKQISVSQVYVPNVYRIFLNPGDWSPLTSFGNSFLLELSKYVYAEGRRFGYTFLTKPAIELHADEQIEPRQMSIEVDVDDAIVVEWEDVSEEALLEEDQREQTNIYREEVRTNFAPPPANSRNQEYFLEVMEGEDTGRRYPLKGDIVYLGRHSQCEITLSDPEASRRHIKLTREAAGWLLDDLGSTNGAWVNGRRTARQAIVPGDKIQIGQTALTLRLSGNGVEREPGGDS